MRNQTAVEWLEQNMPDISKHIPLGIAIEFAAKIQQAKTMEKEQVAECPKGIKENEKAHTKAKKPPIGIMPKKIHYETRLSELRNVISMHMQAGIGVNTDWVKECNEIVKALEDIEMEEMREMEENRRNSIIHLYLFLDHNRLDLQVKRLSYQNDLWTAYIDYFDMKMGSLLVGVHGSGKNPSDAILDYANRIRGKEFVFMATTKHRKEFCVPKGLFYN